MGSIRVIPSLLLSGSKLIKTIAFRSPTYVGDPRNAVKLFNEMEVDELVLFDIEASRKQRIQFDLLEELASEAFMPVAYGGGICSREDAKQLFAIGLEKVVLNTAAIEHPTLIRELADDFGSQSIVACVDVKRHWFHKRHQVYSHVSRGWVPDGPVAWAQRFESLGAGELIIQSVDRDGTMKGYDLELLHAVSSAVRIPCIGAGGAGSLSHLRDAVTIGGVQAVAAGSLFVFHGKHRAVLVNYPSQFDLRSLFEGI